MQTPLIPKALKQGETIAFISPSARLNDKFPAVISRATDILSSQGYNIRTLYTPDTTIQSSITNRLHELRTALTDPTISAIICTIGGTTFTELLPSLIADTALHTTIRARPKIVVGYSDITGLHFFLHALTGLRTFYGPCIIPELGAAEPLEDENAPLSFCVRNLLAAIANPQPIGPIPRSPIYAPKAADIFTSNTNQPTRQQLAPTTGWKWLRRGKARGRLFGGCLTVVARLNGIHAIRPDWRGRIIFLETAVGDDEKGPPLARVQAGFADLIAQGVFDEAAGLVVGRAFGYDSEKQRGDYVGVIKGLLCEGPMGERRFPILFGVDIGHTTPMVTLPFGAMAEMEKNGKGEGRFEVVESGVV